MATKRPVDQLRLYGSSVSLFTVKVISYLTFKGLPFELIRVTDEIAETVIKPVTGGWRVVPVLQTSAQRVIQDSRVIIDELESDHQTRSICPPGVKQKMVAALFELLGDDWLLFPAMHYRWNFKRHNLAYILSQFGKTRRPNLPPLIRWIWGIKNARHFSAVPRLMLGINEFNTAAWEEWTVQFLDYLEEHFERYDYLLGGRPCIGDFSIYGCINAHLANDPYPKEVLIQPRQNVSAWLRRMSERPATVGDWLPGDEIPSTLIPILQSQSTDQLRYIYRLISQTQAWLDQNPDTSEIPRFISETPYEVGSSSGWRLCAPYSQWMYQRVIQPLVGLEETERLSAIEWFDARAINLRLLTREHYVTFRDSKIRRSVTN